MTVQDKIAWMRRGAGLALTICVGAVFASLVAYAAHLAEWLIRGRVSHIDVRDVVAIPGPIGAIPLCLLAPVAAFAALYVFFALWSTAVQKDIDSHPTR